MSACYRMALIERKVIPGEGEERLYECRCHVEGDVIGYLIENVEGRDVVTYVAKAYEVPKLIGRNDARVWERAYRLLTRAVRRTLEECYQ